MALLSVLTPVLAVVLCIVLGFMFVKPRETTAKTKEEPKADFRPWVDQDLQDNTEVKAKEDSK